MHPPSFNTFGAPVVCDDGCLTLCDECMAELGDASKAYIGSGEDAPVAFKRSNQKESVLQL